MKSNRKTATIVGVLFIIGTVSGILSAVITGPIWDAPDYLVQVSAQQNAVVLGALCVLTMGLSLAMVPVMMFPIFKRYNEALAFACVVFRGALEAVLYIAMVISWIFLVLLSQEFAQAGGTAAPHYQTIGAILLNSDEQMNHILTIVFSIGAMIFYYLFYRTKLIPRWLSGWGLIGAILYFAAGIIGMFGVEAGYLLAPLGLQEMVLALWLIVKGFNSPAIEPNAEV